MFNFKHYVPVLRWKRAEWVALRNIHPRYRKLITPLIEIIPKKFNSAHSQEFNVLIEQIGNDLIESWGGLPLFLELGLFTTERHFRLQNNILTILSNEVENIIPVVSVNLSASYQRTIRSILQQCNQGVCLRIKKNDLRRSTLPKAINNLLSDLRLTHKKADLVVDLEIIDSSCPSLSDLSTFIPSLSEWRSFTVISGAFPQDLTGFSPGQHLLPRLDWQNWLSQVTSSKQKFPRKPSFGDYTIQYPIYSEPPERANFSASIRYTASSNWVIMRGESAKTMGFNQWPANALLLCERSEFCGPNFSVGDQYIYDRSQMNDSTGNPETWLRAAINHHLTFVVNQFSSLLGS